MTTKEEAKERAGLEFSYLIGTLKKSGIDYDKDLKSQKVGIDFLIDDKWGNRIATFGPSGNKQAYANTMYDLSVGLANDLLSQGRNTEVAKYMSEKIVKIAEKFKYEVSARQQLRAA